MANILIGANVQVGGTGQAAANMRQFTHGINQEINHIRSNVNTVNNTFNRFEQNLTHINNHAVNIFQNMAHAANTWRDHINMAFANFGVITVFRGIGNALRNINENLQQTERSIIGYYRRN